MSALAVPRLTRGIALEIAPPSEARRRANLALQLCDAGVLADLTLPDRWTSPLEACETALRGWIESTLGTVRFVRPSFSMELAVRSWSDDREGWFLTQWKNGPPQDLIVGPGLDAVERRYPGLGRAAAEAMQRQQSFRMYGPSDAFETASWLCWEGEDDEMAAMEVNGEDPDDFLSGIVRRADIDAAYPSWAYDTAQPQLSNQELRAFHRQGGLGGEVAGHVLAIRLASKRQFRRAMRASVREPESDDDDDGDDYGYFVGYGARLLWRAEDVTLRLHNMDDEHGKRNDCHDWMHRTFCPLDEPAKLREWRAQTTLRLHVMRRMDALLSLVVDG